MLAGSQEGLAPLSGRCCPYLIFLPTHSTEASKLVGSVAIYGNEIDDLIVGKSYQRAGYGEALLQFAISHMQSNNISPIVLHVADWNQGAIKMYMKNGFAIVKTEET